MIRNEPVASRDLALQKLECDLAVAGGGLAGICCAITAARAGLSVVVIQDRPVVGGNASSEVRLWILGATSHMGNNNRWAREGGVIDEILLENIYRNPEGNPLILDTVLLEKVIEEPNITLLLNTAVFELEKQDRDTIKSIRAFCSQNSTLYEVSAPLFCDASGDGIVGFLAGAAFRVGVEAGSEFGEKFGPPTESQELLGHTIYFYSKDMGRPVRFVPPSYALEDITRIPRFRDFNAKDFGCRLWWIEWGGQLDTIHDSERIKWELWKVVYGVWNHIKNSGQFPEAENLTLEWVGTIPGKRESRRFEGDWILRQQDVVEQRRHQDAVSFGGWAIDLHPAEGVFSDKPGCAQWHSKGVYQIPYRCLYSRNIANLFLAGRGISASHIAYGSTRVMATCATNAQAVGMAAALCKTAGVRPRDLLQAPLLMEYQRELLKSGQFIPGIALEDPADLARSASISASSELSLAELAPCGETRDLTESWAMMLPVNAGPMPSITFTVDVSKPVTLRAELRVSSKPENHTPDATLASIETSLAPGKGRSLALRFEEEIDQPRYAFVCLMACDGVAVHLSNQRCTGVLSVSQKFNRAVAKSPRQEPPPDSGIDSFEFWLPERRPGGKNMALKIQPPLPAFQTANLTNGMDRPTSQPNAWVAAFAEEQPWIRLSWPIPQTISRIELRFDADYDHPAESVLMGHPERVMPFCVPNVVVLDGSALKREKLASRAILAGKGANDTGLLNGSGNGSAADSEDQVLARLEGNHLSRRVLHFKQVVSTDCLELHLTAPNGFIPAALFAIRCYS
jgi:hypothetical protein